MKKIRSLLLLFFIPLFGFTQSLNGVYTGVLSNDSTTVRKDQSFEMALTEYKGKVYGYAYSTFIVNDTLYYIVKRVKGNVEGDICEVEDDEVIAHNFPQKPEKKIFVTYTLRRGTSDSIWRLDGNWKTNLVQKRKYGYYVISGKVETKEEKDLSKSKLYEHLGDLDLQKTLAFNKPKETTPEKKSVKAKENKNAIAKNTVKKEEKKNVQKADTRPDDKKPDVSIVKTETKLPDNKSSASVNNEANQTEKKDVAISNTNSVDKKAEPNIVKPENKLPDNKTASVPANSQSNEKKDIAATNTNTVSKKPGDSIAKTDTKIPDNKIASVTVNNQSDKNEKKDVPVTNTITIVNPDNKTSSTAINNQPNPNEKKNVIADNATPVDKKPEVSVAKPETKLPDNKSIVTANNQPDQNEKKNVAVANINSIDKKPDASIVKTENKQTENKIVSVPVNYQSVPNDKKPATVENTTSVDKKPETSIVKTDNKQPENKIVSINNQANKNEKIDIAIPEKKTEAEFEFQELKRNRTLKPASSLVDGRVSVPSETIYFTSDSLSIALYDNGEVDGDTVSVIINDELFIEKQGLKSSAFRKTFYIPQGQGDSLLVVLYADNLGKYPPNTGLLQIKDGEEIFYVRFKADLNRNAAIVLRKKYK